jgi:hypothetical protein
MYFSKGVEKGITVMRNKTLLLLNCVKR